LLVEGIARSRDEEHPQPAHLNRDGTYTCVQDVLTRLATRKASRVEQPRSHRPENTERPIDSR